MQSRIEQPGIYDLSAAQYHADPCVIPSLSRSIAKLLCELSPEHAAAAHPRLAGLGVTGGGDDDEPAAAEPGDSKEDRDVGTVAHAMFLRGEAVAEVVEFDSYRSKDAKAARDAILAAGKVPLKRVKYDEVMRLLDVLERFRARTGAFTKGRAEQTLIWQEGPVWCRCMVDWLPDDPAEPLWDIKTTGGRIKPQTWMRSCYESANDIQAVFYCRGAAELRDGEMPPGMKFAVCETKAPFGVKVFELAPAAWELAEMRLSYAMRLWAQCQADGEWPGYPETVEYVEPPSWILREWDWKARSALPASHAIREAAREVTTQKILDTGSFP